MPNPKLEQTIYEMLVENTGTALCDSGGIYGRNWEKNKGKTLADFKREPSVSFDQPTKTQPHLDYVSVSIFKVLTEYAELELDELCDEYNHKFIPAKDWNSDIFGVSEKAERWLTKNSFTSGDSWNTYNEESNLSQVLQGTILKHASGDSYVLMQVHGGADVRGGYTDARLFKLTDDYINLDPPIYAEIDGDTFRFDGSKLYHDNNESTDGQEYTKDFTAESKIKLFLQND